MRRILPAILLVAVLALGGGLIWATAYQAGQSTVVTTATASGGSAVAPVVVPAYGYGYGWHPFGFGFGIFGFFATLFFVFVVFALIRAIVWRGGHGRRGGWGGGWGGPGAAGGPGRSPWEARAHETFEDWHRRAHGDAPPPDQHDPGRPVGTA
jgi:hypothetical protein